MNCKDKSECPSGCQDCINGICKTNQSVFVQDILVHQDIFLMRKVYVLKDPIVVQLKIVVFPHHHLHQDHLHQDHPRHLHLPVIFFL